MTVENLAIPLRGEVILMRPEELNREFINKLALHNPAINTALDIYIRGGLTYEQTLIAMVAWLVTHNEELARLLKGPEIK